MTALTATDATGAWQNEFEERGYVILRGVVEPAIVTGLRHAMETLVEERAQLLNDQVHAFADEPLETRMFRLYENRLDQAPKFFRTELHKPELFDLFFHPRLLDLAEVLLGPEVRLYPNYTARPKLPGWEGTQVLWHQDGGYTEAASGPQSKLDAMYLPLPEPANAANAAPSEPKAPSGVDALRMVNVWTPLVPVNPENGCMQFIPGTHKLGVVPHEKRTYYLEIAPDHLKERLGEAVEIEMEPGDVVLFHNLLFHQGQPNRAQTIRWSLDWRYQDATQPTLRKENGHLARSLAHPEQVVQSAQDWATRTFS